MVENVREFEAGPDPFDRMWKVKFIWLQTAISIRHSDSVDVKFLLSDGETQQEKVIAIMHPDLLALSAESGRPVTDPWCMKLASAHLRRVIASGDDMEKALITMSMADLREAGAALLSATRA